MKTPENGRQIYATVREDLYLAAKSRATELRMPLRRFIEHALELALSDHAASSPAPGAAGDPTGKTNTWKCRRSSLLGLPWSSPRMRPSGWSEPYFAPRTPHQAVIEWFPRQEAPYQMANLLLDTTVLNDYRRGDTGARTVIDKISGGKLPPRFVPLTIFDIWGSSDLDRRSEMGYLGMLRFLEEAPLSNEAARVAGLWVAALDEEERKQLTRFALVAATAREREEPICTRSPEPYSKFYSEFVSY